MTKSTLKKMKKIVATLGVASTVSIVSGCEDIDLNKTSNNIVVETEIPELTTEFQEDIETNNNNDLAKTQLKKKELKTEYNKNNKQLSKDEIIRLINNSNYNNTIKDIFSEIVKSSKDKNLLNYIKIACQDKDFILSAFQLASYNASNNQDSIIIDNLKIFNNLDGKEETLQKRIYLFSFCKDYGKYKIYENRLDTDVMIVTNQDNEIILSIDNYSDKTITKHKNLPLSNYSYLLKTCDIDVPEKYTFNQLLNSTYNVCRHLANYNNPKRMKTKNIMVIDTKLVETQKTNVDENYLFLKYCSPYLFSNDSDVYVDVFNSEASCLIMNDNTIDYIDSNKNINLFDIDYNYVGEPGTYSDQPCFYNLDKFLQTNGINSTKYITIEELSEINNCFNNNKVKIKNKK